MSLWEIKNVVNANETPSALFAVSQLLKHCDTCQMEETYDMHAFVTQLASLMEIVASYSADVEHQTKKLIGQLDTEAQPSLDRGPVPSA